MSEQDINSIKVENLENLSEEEIMALYESVVTSPDKIYISPSSGEGKWAPGGMSDIRLKEILGDNQSGLKEINSLQVKNYIYKNDNKKLKHVGVIAQDLMKIFPDSVQQDENGYYYISSEEIFWAMVKSIQQLSEKVDKLTK